MKGDNHLSNFFMTCLFFISEDVKVLFCLGLMNTLIIDLNVSIQNNFKICDFVRGLPGFDMSPQFVYVLVFERKKKFQTPKISPKFSKCRMQINLVLQSQVSESMMIF